MSQDYIPLYDKAELQEHHNDAYENGWNDGYAEGFGEASQSCTLSFMESVANTGVGFLISVGAAFLIFPLLGIQSSASQNVGAVLLFTIVSILRNYIIRRLFNA